MRSGIMVPLDGTRFSEAALPAAIYLARRDGLSLTLVTVLQPLFPLYDSTGWAERWDQEVHAERHRYLAEVARKVEAAAGVPVSVECLKGRPTEVLPPVPKLNDLELVVMGTHGYGPMERAALGSVADQMVRRGTAPVLMIHPAYDEPEVELAPARPFREILVPLDGSELAEKALQRSVLMGSGSPVALTLLRVVTFPAPLSLPEGGAAIELDGRIVRAEKEAAQSYLRGVADKLVWWKCPVATEVLTAPSTWSGIVDYARASGFDLIAMSTHGRGGAARLLLGSVADKVVRTATVPVLLFHPERAPSPWHDVDRLAGQVAGMP
jgi:nucleotide-binding universal stress UspA family protein